MKTKCDSNTDDKSVLHRGQVSWVAQIHCFTMSPISQYGAVLGNSVLSYHWHTGSLTTGTYIRGRNTPKWASGHLVRIAHKQTCIIVTLHHYFDCHKRLIFFLILNKSFPTIWTKDLRMTCLLDALSIVSFLVPCSKF